MHYICAYVNKSLLRSKKEEEERVGIGLSEMRQSTKSESVEIGSNLQYIIGE